MSSTTLTKLTIANLRGAVELFELPFEKGKKLTIIYGENGTGKSTICDALEFLCSGKVGSLENRGLGVTTRYWNSVGKKPADVEVQLESSSATCRATMGKNSVVAHPPEARPRVEVLRRSQILSLLEATPGERYKAISRFIDVSGVETSEQALRQLIKDLNAASNIAATRITENIEAIDSFWTAANCPGPDAMTWARAEAARVFPVVDPELRAIRTLQSAYNRLTAYPARLQESSDAVLAAQDAADKAATEAVATLDAVAADAAELITLLQTARTYLRTHTDSAVCPLCERPEGARDLDSRIALRLSNFAAVQQARDTRERAEARLDRAIQQQDLVNEQLAKDVVAYGAAAAAFAWSSDVPLPTTSPPTTAVELVTWLNATASFPERWNVAEAKRQGQQQFITALRGALDTYDTNLRSQADLSVLLPNVERALIIVEQERQAFTNRTLSIIAAEVGRLYEAVHPGEGLNTISLMLDAARRASLDIATSFGGHTGPPQAYFSQSHLDTLGLCVFIALANLDTPANTILVLDDILASVDEPHVDRLIGMLYEESLKFRHCIITTHYGPWRHKLRWGWLKHNQCQFVELSRWSRTQGISLIRSVPEVERLRAMLNDPAPDQQAICSKAGVVLEAALDFLTQLYECSVPRKPEPRYRLGELLPAVKGKLRKSLKVEIWEADPGGVATHKKDVPLAPLLDELERIMQTRNVVGCHFNELSFALLDSDALYFGQKVLELIEALVDPAAGWPRNGKSGSYWANAGETRRLHPLKQPS